MAVQNGKDLLVKIDLTSDGNFQTVAGLRATRISFNAESVDVTSLESAGGWRELLSGAGVKSASISGSGIFRDAASDERARQIFSIDYAGTHDGEATYELSLASAGQLTFTAA
jgi:TP901-1 family phage major tail protein